MNSNSGLKRSSVFGEGVAKRPRNDGRDKPRNTGASKPGSDLFSGTDFHAKPASASGKRLQARASDTGDMFSAFEKTAVTNFARPKAIGALPPRPPPPVLSDTSAQDGHRKTMTPIKSRLQPPLLCAGKASRSGGAPLTERMCQLGLPVAKPTTPARKGFPFNAFSIPVPEISATPSTIGLKPLPSPKFDLGGRSKGNMKAMTKLEHPVVGLQEENEVRGEALELQRGLLISPEKKNGRGRRFIRNGLAERAQRLADRSSTAFTLWKKELESHASTSRLGRLRPDLRVRVTRVLHTTRISNVHARSTGTLRSVLANCQMLDTSAIPMESSLRTILFSFSPESHDSHVMDSDVEMADGMDVLIWRPWSEIRPPEDKNADVGPLPSTPPGPGHVQLPLRVDDTSTLLCSRFLVLPLKSEL